MLCIVAIVAVHYTHSNTCSVLLLLLAVHYPHISTCSVLLLLLMYTTYISAHAMYCCYCCCTLHTYQHMLCIASIVDSTHVHHVGPKYQKSFKDLVIFYRENTTADILIEDQLWPPLDMVTVDQERKLLKPNC